jgi:hypothetical protein
MTQPEPEQPYPRSFFELDLTAWNLPSPRPEPVGPVREIWPVRALPARGVEENLFEDPAAA